MITTGVMYFFFLYFFLKWGYFFFWWATFFLLFSYFLLLSKDRKRQEKTGKGARKNAREKKQESRLQPARGVRVRGPAPLTRALPYHTRP